MTVAEVLETLSDMLVRLRGRSHAGPCEHCDQQEKEARALDYAIRAIERLEAEAKAAAEGQAAAEAQAPFLQAAVYALADAAADAEADRINAAHDRARGTP